MKKYLLLTLLFTTAVAWADLAQGTVVEYNTGAKWIPAKIIERIPNGYKILLMPPGIAPYEVISTEANVRASQGGQTTNAGAPANPGPVVQNQAGTGQRVEYNQGATWAPAEVLAQIPGGYRLRVKPPGGREYEVVSTNANVRPQQNATQTQPAPQPPKPAAPAATTKETNAARLDNTNTQVDRPNARLIEAVMRSMWERDAAPGMDGAVTLAFQNIAIGDTRAWSVLDGNQGTPGTAVWTAKVNWTHTTHYRARNRVLIRNWTVSVFKNAAGKWVVQSTASTPQSETVREDPPDMR